MKLTLANVPKARRGRYFQGNARSSKKQEFISENADQNILLALWHLQNVFLWLAVTLDIILVEYCSTRGLTNPFLPLNSIFRKLWHILI